MELRVNSEVTDTIRTELLLPLIYQTARMRAAHCWLAQMVCIPQFAQSWWATAHREPLALDISSRDPGRIHA